MEIKKQTSIKKDPNMAQSRSSFSKEIYNSQQNVSIKTFITQLVNSPQGSYKQLEIVLQSFFRVMNQGN